MSHQPAPHDMSTNPPAPPSRYGEDQINVRNVVLRALMTVIFVWFLFFYALSSFDIMFVVPSDAAARNKEEFHAYYDLLVLSGMLLTIVATCFSLRAVSLLPGPRIARFLIASNRSQDAGPGTFTNTVPPIRRHNSVP